MPSTAGGTCSLRCEGAVWAVTHGGHTARVIELITDELARAMGLAGRDRLTGSTTERARASVTKAIRAVIRAIATTHPALADVLSRTIRTGTYCTYDPMAEVPIQWSVDRGS